MRSQIDDLKGAKWQGGDRLHGAHRKLETHEIERKLKEEKALQNKKSIAFKDTPTISDEDEDFEQDDDEHVGPRLQSWTLVLMITKLIGLWGTNQIQVFKFFRFREDWVSFFLKGKVFKVSRLLKEGIQVRKIKTDFWRSPLEDWRLIEPM